jgi:hypothetical protein
VLDSTASRPPPHIWASSVADWAVMSAAFAAAMVPART